MTLVEPRYSAFECLAELNWYQCNSNEIASPPTLFGSGELKESEHKNSGITNQIFHATKWLPRKKRILSKNKKTLAAYALASKQKNKRKQNYFALASSFCPTKKSACGVRTGLHKTKNCKTQRVLFYKSILWNKKNKKRLRRTHWPQTNKYVKSKTCFDFFFSKETFHPKDGAVPCVPLSHTPGSHSPELPLWGIGSRILVVWNAPHDFVAPSGAWLCSVACEGARP